MPLASLLGWSKFGAALQPPPLEPRASFPPSGLPRGGGSPPGGPPSRSTRGGEIAPLFPGEREGEGVREGVGGRPKRASRRAGRGGTPQALEEARGGGGGGGGGGGWGGGGGGEEGGMKYGRGGLKGERARGAEAIRARGRGDPKGQRAKPARTRGEGGRKRGEEERGRRGRRRREEEPSRRAQRKKAGRKRRGLPSPGTEANAETGGPEPRGRPPRGDKNPRSRSQRHPAIRNLSRLLRSGVGNVVPRTTEGRETRELKAREESPPPSPVACGESSAGVP